MDDVRDAAVAAFECLWMLSCFRYVVVAAACVCLTTERVVGEGSNPQSTNKTAACASSRLHAVGPLSFVAGGHDCWVLEVYSLGT